MPRGRGAAVGDYRNIVAGFMEAMRTKSVFYRLINDNAFIHRADAQTDCGDHEPPPPHGSSAKASRCRSRRLSLANQMLTPVRAAALIVMTDALIRDTQRKPDKSFFAKRIAQGAVGRR